MPISEVYNMDCMEYMKGIPDKFFDLAIVDPQYGIDIMHKGGMPKHLGFKQYKRKDWDARGDQVEWYNPLCEYDKVYAAKVFTFTPDYNYYINTNQIEKGGTGYDIEKVLPVEVDRIQPDYSIYNIDSNLSYGFLTRGCPNRCKWCVVPKKEGKISPYMDIEEITAGRKKLSLWIIIYWPQTMACSK